MLEIQHETSHPDGPPNDRIYRGAQHCGVTGPLAGAREPLMAPYHGAGRPGVQVMSHPLRSGLQFLHALLAQQKLHLDDDIRKHLAELSSSA